MLRVTRICDRLPVDTAHTQSLMCEKSTQTHARTHGLNLLRFTISEVHLPHFTSCFLWQIRSVLGSNPLITCADNSLTAENGMRRERLQLKNEYKVIMRMWFSSCGLLCAWLCSLESARDGEKVAGREERGERRGEMLQRWWSRKTRGKTLGSFHPPPARKSRRCTLAARERDQWENVRGIEEREEDKISHCSESAKRQREGERNVISQDQT